MGPMQNGCRIASPMKTRGLDSGSGSCSGTHGTSVAKRSWCALVGLSGSRDVHPNSETARACPGRCARGFSGRRALVLALPPVDGSRKHTLLSLPPLFLQYFICPLPVSCILVVTTSLFHRHAVLLNASLALSTWTSILPSSASRLAQAFVLFSRCISSCIYSTSFLAIVHSAHLRYMLDPFGSVAVVHYRMPM